MDAVDSMSPNLAPSDARTEGKPKDDCHLNNEEHGGIRGWYSRQLVKLPVAIGMCVGLLLITVACGIVSLVVYDSPDFNQPTKGFEARGTDLSARLFSFYNIYNSPMLSYWYLVNSGGHPSNMSKTLGFRAKRDLAERNISGVYRNNSMLGEDSGIEFCQTDSGIDIFYQPAVVFEAHGTDDMFTRQALVSMCSQYDSHIENSAELQSSCCQRPDGSCSDNWSLGNYVALLNKRTSCQDIQDIDVVNTQSLLRKCASHYQRQTLKLCRDRISECPQDVPIECLSYDHAVYSIFHYLVPSAFVEDAFSGNFNLRYSLLFLPTNSLLANIRMIYEQAFQGKLIDDGVTSVVALGFGRLKFELFSDYLLSDTLYIGLGAALVFTIIWIYTGSLFVTIMTIINMGMSLVVAYFAFVVIFRLPFFPFVNIASAVLIIGIGADDAFVYLDIWCQTKSANSAARPSSVLRETLHHASVTMFVTSFTTASALYSSVVSSITAVRCFGVYAGTAIVVNFIFTLTWLPAVVVIYSRIQNWCTEMNNNCSPGFLTKLNNVHTGIGSAYRKVFSKYLPIVVIKLRYLWIIMLASLGVGAFCVVYISPKLRLPTTAEFQVFRDNDLFELYDNVYKPLFDTEENDVLFVSAVFGVEAVDNGNHWNPDDRGSLIVKDGFNIFHPGAQEWLLDLCYSFRNQSFYDSGRDNGWCFIDQFRSRMEAPCGAFRWSLESPCCGQTAFPYPANLFEKCLKVLRRCDVAISPCEDVIVPGPLFSTKDGSVTAFLMRDRSSVSDAMDFKSIDDFWIEANTWFDKKLKTKPASIAGGWLYAGSMNGGQQLYFYNLQSSLANDTPISMGLSLVIAAIVLLVTTWNILISLYAMISIASAFCVTVGTLVLLDWRLNIFESAILSLAVGLSVDFTIHYGVAYRLASSDSRSDKTLNSIQTVGSAITVAALSTFAAGAMMMPSIVITYTQLGIFLMLVMTISWVYGTFFFLSVCSVIGPQGQCAQIPFPARCFSRKARRSSTSKSSVTPGNAVTTDESNVIMLTYKGATEENHCVAENSLDERPAPFADKAIQSMQT